MTRFFYSLALWLLLPWVMLRLLWRARRQPGYLRHVGERFGRYPAHDGSPLIWLHAVSVGETRATQRLVAELQAAYPGHRLLLTHATPTGRETGKQLYGNTVLRAYLPYDYPFAVRHFLRHYRPQIGILMETEIWFNLIHACHEEGVPLLLLNARLSEKSARGYARFAGLTRAALERLAAVGAQTEDDAIRLKALGVREIAITGNLKFDIEPPPAQLELGKELRELFGKTRRVFLAASTRDGEEALLLDALFDPRKNGAHSASLPASKPPLPPPCQGENEASPPLTRGGREGLAWSEAILLIIVPRHPQRFDEVARLLEQRGIQYQRRSENRPVAADAAVVLGDSMGELFAYYAAADLAFIGGSLLPFGAQNLIESCAAGTPVLVGQHTWNFAEATRLALASGAAVQVHDVVQLVREMRRLLENEAALEGMRRQCAGFVAANRGATEKSLEIVKRFCP